MTRALLGVEGAAEGAAIRVYGAPPMPVTPGRTITFDDCEMHEAWNASPQRRIALIFGLSGALRRASDNRPVMMVFGPDKIKQTSMCARRRPLRRRPLRRRPLHSSVHRVRRKARWPSGAKAQMHV